MSAFEQVASPIFRSVDQALHVAFLMDILPVRERSQMGRIIERMMVEAGVTAGRSESGSVNFGGLSPLDVRGQCAMIRAAVKDHLAQHQACSVWARWGHQTTKAEGVRGMVDYCGPLLSVGHGHGEAWLSAWLGCGDRPDGHLHQPATVLWRGLRPRTLAASRLRSPRLSVPQTGRVHLAMRRRNAPDHGPLLQRWPLCVPASR